MAHKLKHCPFCGGLCSVRHVSPYRDASANNYFGYFVMCLDCLTTSDNFNSYDEAVSHWNRRIPLG